MPHGDHEMNWVNAIKGTRQISAPFDYAAHLTEIMLLGVVSLRANSKLHYDAANMRVTNNLAANDFLTREYPGLVRAVGAIAVHDLECVAGPPALPVKPCGLVTKAPVPFDDMRRGFRLRAGRSTAGRYK